MGQLIQFAPKDTRKSDSHPDDGSVTVRIAETDDLDGIDIVAENVRRSDDYCDSDAGH